MIDEGCTYTLSLETDNGKKSLAKKMEETHCDVSFYLQHKSQGEISNLFVLILPSI